MNLNSILTLLWLMFLSANSFAQGKWTWQQPLPHSMTTHDVIWADTHFVAVGSSGLVMTSKTGENWTFHHTPAFLQLSTITYKEGLYVAAGFSGRGALISKNGINWIRIENLEIDKVSQALCFDSLCVLGNTVGDMYLTTDGLTWEHIELETGAVMDLTWDGNYLYLLASYDELWRSTDGRSWEKHGDIPFSCYNVMWKSPLFVAGGNWGFVMVSPDGKNWEKRVVGKDELHAEGVSNLIWTGSEFFGSLGKDTIITSANGTDWMKYAIEPGNSPGIGNNLAYNGENFISLGKNGSYGWSANGINWNWHHPERLPNLNEVVWSGAMSVAVGDSGYIISSPDGREWTKEESGTEARLNDIVFVDGTFYAVGDSGIILTSKDGSVWDKKSFGNLFYLKKFVITDSAYFILASDDVYFKSDKGKGWSQHEYRWQIEDIIWLDSQFIGYGEDMLLYKSKDGIEWEYQVFNDDSVYSNDQIYPKIESMVYTGTHLVLGFKGGGILYSEDAETWSGDSTLHYPNYSRTLYWNGQELISFNSQEMYATTDFHTWTKKEWGRSMVGSGLTWTGEYYIAVGSGGSVLTSPTENIIGIDVGDPHVGIENPNSIFVRKNGTLYRSVMLPGSQKSILIDILGRRKASP